METSCEITVDIQTSEQVHDNEIETEESNRTGENGTDFNLTEETMRNEEDSIPCTFPGRQDNNVDAAETFNDEIETNSSTSLSDEVSFVFSLIQILLFTLLSIVFIISHYTHDQVTDQMFRIYNTVLLSVGTFWYILFFVFKSKFCKKRQLESAKSQEPSNRWLKGVIGLFGIAVVTSECLQLVNGIMTHQHQDCKNPILIVQPIMQACFVTLQLGFLFNNAKLHIPRLRHISRFGLAHILVTNLTIWIKTIAEEADSALQYGHEQDADGSEDLTVESSAAHDTNDTEECYCNTSFCDVSIEFRHFLFPFQIEFCLISSCLIYIMWRNIGKPSSLHHGITKPCYSFLNSYKGLFIGAFTVILSVIMMIVLATTTESSEQLQSQHIFDGYIMLCDLLILLACVVCFGIKMRHKNQFRKLIVNLDVVLLFVCLIGPFTLNLFSIVAISFGEYDGHELTIALCLIDTLMNIAQVLLTGYGLSCLPVLTKPRNAISTDSLTGYWNEFYANSEETCSQSSTKTEYGCSSTNFTSSSNSENYDNAVVEDNISIEEENNNNQRNKQAVEKNNFNPSRRTSVFSMTTNEERTEDTLKSKSSKKKKSKSGDNVAGGRPSKFRILFRDSIMFLILINASLWVFYSFNGTIYKVDRLESDFYGVTTWVTIRSVANPFAIYFKMHLAACLFEVWTLS